MKFIHSAILLLVVCAATACGKDEVASQPSSDWVREETVPAGGTPCGGCIDDSGACVAGTADRACGGGGGDCAACDATQVCLAGVCGEPPPCGPDTCDGCCDGDGQCVSGTASDACGLRGAGCATCGGGTACEDGLCVETCGPTNCAGCCDATGACVGGDQDLSCGMGGGVCSDCTAVGRTCAGGTCANTDCATSCTGCCAGETCVTAPTVQQCGAAGGVCMACGAGETCTNGACTPVVNPTSDEWNVILVSASIAPTKFSGAGWDSFDPAPDPSMEVYAYDFNADWEWYNYTLTQYETYDPVWDETILQAVTTDALVDGLEFYLVDVDDFFDDEICYDIVFVDPLMMSGQDITTTCSVDPLTSWTWRLEPAP